MSMNEMTELMSWIGNPPRSPRQTHGLNESDSEILDFGNGTYLAATVDTVSEEIALGLYRNPYKIGWVTAMASLSDLAAVGAQPLGLLLSAEWAASLGIAEKSEVARGFSDALRHCHTFWLGGDTGQGRSTVLGGVALGICQSKPLSRMGMKPGDILCLTGSLGNGPALAMRCLMGETSGSFDEEIFAPVARTEAGQALREIAHAAMDTSDGLVSTLNTLKELNGSGLELLWCDEMISEPARQFCARNEIPLWMLWEIEHGDYQLVLAIAPEKLEIACKLVPDLHVMGRVTQGSQVSLSLPDGRKEIMDLDLAQRLLSSSRKDLKGTLMKLIEYARERKLP